jgi:uncharacterized protein (DUF1800 family)
MSRVHRLLVSYRPGEGDPFDRVKAAHLLNRAGFGGTEQQIEKVLELGPQDAVEWLLDFPDQGAEEQTPEDVPDLSMIEGHPKNFREVRELLEGRDEEERRRVRQMLRRAQGEAIRATAGWWVKRMGQGPYPLQEKLALFWHGHFTTSAQDTQSGQRMWQQNELLRRMAAGNFRQFLRQISRDPAMLDYLNNQKNRRGRPNENYARELLELFTLGIGNYGEQDVKEAARAFTGWGHNGDSFEFRRRQHDDGEKEFLGRRGRFDGDDIIDIILMQPACGRHVGAKLFRFFAYEEIEEPVLASLGRLLPENRWELRPLLRTILTSRAFYSGKAIGTQIKSPLQLVVGTVRQLEMEAAPPQVMQQGLRQMGQVPFYPPNVQGWPGGQRWINSSTLFVRYNISVRLVEQAPRGVFAPSRGQLAGEIAEQWVQRLIQRPIDEEKMQVLVEALGSERPDRAAVRRMVQLIVSMPEYQLC